MTESLWIVADTVPGLPTWEVRAICQSFEEAENALDRFKDEAERDHRAGRAWMLSTTAATSSELGVRFQAQMHGEVLL